MRLLTRDLRARWGRHRDLAGARRSLLAAEHLTPEERHLVASLSLDVHPYDSMYVAGQADHYLGVGLSATRCIRQALGTGDVAHVRSVLDFPSGYGRVLRWLRVMFAGAEITCGEIDSTALRFCSRVFGVRTVASHLDIEAIAIPRTFDLIWCGSLLTHFTEQRTAAFLRLFCQHLSEKGVCVFTMHGHRSLEWIKRGTVTYGLSQEAQDTLLLEFERKGYGYAPSEGSAEYGISLAAELWMEAAARLAGPWKRVLFNEAGWDNHQDVYAFVRTDPSAL